MIDGPLEAMTPQLTLEQVFRLVEIAHETRIPEAREFALALLKQHFSPVEYKGASYAA